MYIHDTMDESVHVISCGSLFGQRVGPRLPGNSVQMTCQQILPARNHKVVKVFSANQLCDVRSAPGGIQQVHGTLDPGAMQRHAAGQP